MTDAALPSRPDRAEHWAERLADSLPWVLLALVLLLLGLRLQLVFTANVNWDEFLYLAMVHDGLRGDLGVAFQSFQVHAFGWLALVSDNEVNQVIVARLAIYALSLASAGLLYVIGRRFLTPSAALFALLCAEGFGYLVDHGASFRADPICAFLLLAAVALLLMRRRPLWAPPLAGLAMAVALLVSIKSLLYLPLLAMVFVYLGWQRGARRAALRDAALFLLTLSLGLLLLYGLHRLSLPETAHDDAAGYVGGAAGKMFLSGEIFPRLPFFVRSLVESPVTWIAIFAGAGFALAMACGRSGERRAEGLLLLGLLSPLMVLPLYRNAFPYFYVFALTPAVPLAGLAFERVLAARPGRSGWLPLVVALAATAMILVGLVSRGEVLKADETRAQHQLIEAVHRVFPEPVPYIDWAGMIARYPKVGFFMSSWGLESYAARNRPVFQGLIERERPPFLLTDVRALDLARPWGRARAGDGYRLLRADYAALKANYVPHWGPIWVAGKHVMAGAPGAPTPFEILMPGHYRVEADEPVILDGRRYEPGETIALAAGPHRVAVGGGVVGASATLRWAAARPGPAEAPLEQPVYRGF